ncbi:MAG: hypothetical protein E7274_12770 [Pseudobutyrivibrio ruminis]|nr:hypothetical protein [Pseudobutyrivibrio ruminis]
MGNIMIMNTIINEIIQCKWLSRLGVKDHFQFEVEYVSKTEMKKKIKSQAWENAVLEKRGDFTVFLHKNFNEEYQKWNNYTEELKSGLLKEIMEHVNDALEAGGFEDFVRVDIQFNILTLLMLYKYENVFSSTFFDQMIEIYLSGHIPCGWNGECFIIY